MSNPWSYLLVVMFCTLCGAAAGCGVEMRQPIHGRNSQAIRLALSDGIVAAKRDESGVDAAAQGWGNLKGRFTLAGAPEPARIEVKGEAFCGKMKLVDESIVVNKMGNGLANVLLFLYTKRGVDPPIPHESYAKSAQDRVVLDNKKCRFVPHVTLLRTSQALVVKNSDAIAHNTNIATANNPWNVIGTGKSVEARFPKAERMPARIGCNIHPWMKGWLVVRDSPYMAVTNDDGEFEIKNLPAGTWTFQVWHERAGYVSDVEGQKGKWPRGRVSVTINGGETTDLGSIKLEYGTFK